MAVHNIVGTEGERAARDFLIARGLTVRETNWRMGKLELDIVAQEQDVLHIIEVKTRDASTVDDFDPMDAVDRKKQRNLINAANAYVNYYSIDFEIAYDVMVIVYDHDSGTYTIDFYDNAFYPPLRTF